RCGGGAAGHSPAPRRIGGHHGGVAPAALRRALQSLCRPRGLSTRPVAEVLLVPGSRPLIRERCPQLFANAVLCGYESIHPRTTQRSCIGECVLVSGGERVREPGNR